jgi:type II secretory pathway pseudopilin PulG
MNKRIRNQNGSYLIELLMALAISGMLAVALGNSVCQTKGISNRSENSLYASLMAEEILERLRSTPFDSLPSSGVSHNVRVNYGDSTDSTTYETTPPMLNRPLLIDGSNLQWLVNSGTNLPTYHFKGTAQILIKDGPLTSSGPGPVTKTATVTVTWSDGDATGPHVLTLSRMLSRFGIQRNAQN